MVVRRTRREWIWESRVEERACRCWMWVWFVWWRDTGGMVSWRVERKGRGGKRGEEVKGERRLKGKGKGRGTEG